MVTPPEYPFLPCCPDLHSNYPDAKPSTPKIRSLTNQQGHVEVQQFDVPSQELVNLSLLRHFGDRLDEVFGGPLRVFSRRM